jgi:hypothetical protein
MYEMSVAFEVIEAPYPYLCAVYICACGARTTQHGDQAAVVPAHWQVAETPDGPMAICPHCVQQHAPAPA